MKAVHELSHDTIPFSSTSTAAVEMVSTLVGNITLDDLKSGNIQAPVGINRRRIMLDMAMSGNAPLTSEYFRALEKMQAFRDDVMTRYKSKSAIAASALVNAELAAFSEQLKLDTGWTIQADYHNGGH